MDNDLQHNSESRRDGDERVSRGCHSETHGSAVSPDGSKLFVIWNGCRGGKVRGKYPFDTCALTVIHIPESERQL